MLHIRTHRLFSFFSVAQTSSFLPNPRRPALLYSFSTNMSDKTPITTGAATEQQHEDQHRDKPVLTLPAPGDVVAPANTLQVNGPDLKLDLLGPVVVNEDGSMSRIDNWAEMADIEKANVRRILLKRNNQRLARLRAQQQDQEAKDVTSPSPSSSSS